MTQSSEAGNGNAADSSFKKAFLPGLMLGLIVGLLIGAVLPTFLQRPAMKGEPMGQPETMDEAPQSRMSERPDAPTGEQATESAEALPNGTPDR